MGRKATISRPAGALVRIYVRKWHVAVFTQYGQFDDRAAGERGATRSLH